MTLPKDGPEIVVSLPDLLHFSGCADLDELSAVVDDDADVDVCLEELDDGGVEVRGPTIGTELLYPFTMEEFWQVVTKTEEDEVRRLE